MRCVKLFDLSVLQGQDLVTLHDRVDSVCNGYHGAVCEHRFDRILNCLLRFQIDVSGSFVDQDDFTFLEQGPRDAYQLLFADTQILSALFDNHLQTISLLNEVTEPAGLDRLDDLLICELVKGVDVFLDRPLEQLRIL